MTAQSVPKKMLKEGDKAPDFHATADNGEKLSLADFRGKNVILYFYPKANTPG
jgi:thioredoxin-dependent peroxiredoxin